MSGKVVAGTFKTTTRMSNHTLDRQDAGGQGPQPLT
jgi:hypothetical protein